MHAMTKTFEEIFKKHKSTWTAEEKRMVHKMMNDRGITDGTDNDEVEMSNLMCMLYVDGIRDGRSC